MAFGSWPTARRRSSGVAPRPSPGRTRHRARRSTPRLPRAEGRPDAALRDERRWDAAPAGSPKSSTCAERPHGRPMAGGWRSPPNGKASRGCSRSRSDGGRTGSAGGRVLDRPGLGSERTVPRLFGRGRGHDVPGQGGERGRHSLALPSLVLTRGARRLAFLGGDDALVVHEGRHLAQGILDRRSQERARTPTDEPRARVRVGDFDVSEDGREILFDRAREESDIVLFERPDR